MNIINSIKQLPWHPYRRWSIRDLGNINKIIVHQELGEASISQVNNYHIHPNHISQKGCPHFCYHYGIEKNGQIKQVNELNCITWHTRQQNETGIGIMLVGCFNGSGNDIGSKGPNLNQMKALSELTEYLLLSFSLSNQDIYGHYHFGKPACPGFVIQDWIEKKRAVINELDGKRAIEKKIKFIQNRLKKLGYYKEQSDGIIGIHTLKAIREFQKAQRLKVDGIVGPNTWKVLLMFTN